MKLPAPSAGLPGNDLLFNRVPLDPAHRAGLAGHAPVNKINRFVETKRPWAERSLSLGVAQPLYQFVLNSCKVNPIT